MERRAPRYTVWLPVRIEELPDGMAVSHNVSGRGMLLVTASELELGSPVSIVVQLPLDADAGKEKTAHGRVVRVEPNTDDPEGMWPHRLAVEFDEPVPEIEAVLKQLSEAGIAKIQR